MLKVLNTLSGDAGHNCWPDTGASGYKVEDFLTKEVWELVKSKLSNLGLAVKECTPYGSTFNSVSGSLAYRVKLANASNSDLHLCIHFNAGGGTGVECWVIQGGTSEEYAERICKEISSVLNIPNRGVKDGSRLYVPKYTNMPCVLVECEFVDSQDDMIKYDADKIASAIVRAITGQESIAASGNYSSGDFIETHQLEVITQKPMVNSEINANAEIVEDWFYVRDSSGNIIPGRVDIGDMVEILDISYTTQLALVKYPTPSGSRVEYIKNVPRLIKYFNQSEWHNGSTKEPVYQDSTCRQVIGFLEPYEKATPLYRKNGMLHVVYNTNKGANTKSGYVKYDGGFSKF